MRPALALLLIVSFAASACGDDAAGTAIVGCLDSATGRYVSCAGDPRCVDPMSGVQVQCSEAGGGVIGCLDTATGRYVSCAGDPRCVNPATGAEVQCPTVGGDAGSQPGVDAGADDAGPTASPDAASPDAAGPDTASPDTGTGGGGGTLSCEQVFACFDACAGDTTCQKGCTDAGSPPALASFSQFTSCSNASGCAADLANGYTGGYISCVYRFCLDQYQGCFGALIAGTESCAQMVTCMNGCTGGDTACLKTCGEAGTLDGQLEYFDILACGEKTCPGKVGQEWADCVNASCISELTACGQ